MRIVECEQLSDEWWEAKRGIPSASNFHRIITPTGKPSAQADDYVCELVADLACLCPNYFTQQGRPINSYAIQNGIDSEPEARRFYEMERNCDVRRVGLCISDCGRWCCSPDGLVGEDGLLELKVPLLKTQVAYLIVGKLPLEYAPQVHGQLVVTGRAWVDFLSYSPGLDPLLVRVEPNEYTAKLRSALEVFHEKYQAALKFFKREPLTQTLEAAIAETRGQK